MSRLNLGMHLNDVLWAISEGNPGAIHVIMDGMRYGESIDPDNAFQGYGLPLHLDEFQIYGSRVWMLYKDVCRENLAHTIGTLRSVQLGITSLDDLNSAIDGNNKINLEDVLNRVCKELPRFRVNFTV